MSRLLRNWPTLLALLLACVIAPIGAQSAEVDPDDWLSRIAQAMRTQNYQGVMVYLRSGTMQSMRVYHRYRDGRIQERLVSMSGAPTEIHRDGDIVTCVFPKQKTVRVGRMELRGILPARDNFSAQSIREHYSLEPQGEAWFAERDCQVLDLKPKDEYRYGYRMLVDKKTALPLKVDLLDMRGQVLEQMMFSEIEFPEHIDDAVLQAGPDTAGYKWVKHEEPAPASGPEWSIKRTPPGFKAVERSIKHLSGYDRPVQHVLFTDGLATVSVFAADPEGNTEEMLKGGSNMGAVNAYGTMIDAYHVTVVGEVPQKTVQMIGDNLFISTPAIEPPAPTPPAGPESDANR